jgi:adenylate cyclase
MASTADTTKAPLPKATQPGKPAKKAGGVTLPGFGDFNWVDLATLAGVAIVLAGLSVAAVRGMPFLAVAEQYLIDFRLYAFGEGVKGPHPNIVLVTITEETLASLEYRSPVDRSYLAGVVETLRQKGAQVIGVDLMFDQPTTKEKDDQLRQALDKWPVPPVVAWAGYLEGLTKKQVDFFHQFLDGLRVRRGFVTMESDEDGTVRAIYPGRDDDVTNQWLPGFPGALAAQIGAKVSREPIGLLYQTGPQTLTEAVFNEYDSSLIAELPDNLFAGKIVLIGANLPDSDRHRTPLAAVVGHGPGSLPGVVVHAQALSQILDGRQLPRVNGNAEILLAILAGLISMALVLVETRGWLKTTLSLAVVIGFVALVSLPVRFNGPLLPLLAPVIAFLGSLTVGSVYVARRYRDKKRFIRDAFTRYVDKDVVQKLLESPEALETEGEVREMTFLFTDMENFTVLSETTDPRILVKLMGQYFDGICDILIKRGGTIDKFIGDAVVAIFGAPQMVADHPSKAVEAALEIYQWTEKFRERAKLETGVKLGLTRIGVHTGTAIVGNFGSQQRHNYTAMGDTVNTAARLEGANKHLGTAICVSEQTARNCRKIYFLPLGTLLLKGKTSKIDAFTPVDKDRSAEDWFRLYMDAFRALRDGKGDAAEAFAKVGNDNPATRIAEMHASRIRAGARDLEVALEAK